MALFFLVFLFDFDTPAGLPRRSFSFSFFFFRCLSFSLLSQEYNEPGISSWDDWMSFLRPNKTPILVSPACFFSAVNYRLCCVFLIVLVLVVGCGLWVSLVPHLLALSPTWVLFVQYLDQHSTRDSTLDFLFANTPFILIWPNWAKAKQRLRIPGKEGWQTNGRIIGLCWDTSFTAPHFSCFFPRCWKWTPVGKMNCGDLIFFCPAFSLCTRGHVMVWQKRGFSLFFPFFLHANPDNKTTSLLRNALAAACVIGNCQRSAERSTLSIRKCISACYVCYPRYLVSFLPVGFFYPLLHTTVTSWMDWISEFEYHKSQAHRGESTWTGLEEVDNRQHHPFICECWSKGGICGSFSFLIFQGYDSSHENCGIRQLL